MTYLSRVIGANCNIFQYMCASSISSLFFQDDRNSVNRDEILSMQMNVFPSLAEKSHHGIQHIIIKQIFVGICEYLVEMNVCSNAINILRVSNSKQCLYIDIERNVHLNLQNFVSAYL